MLSTPSTEKKTAVPKIVAEAIERFGELMAKSAEAMYTAAKMYVNILEHYPEWVDHFRAKFIQYPISVWKRIEQVGNDQVASEFFPFYGNPAIARLEKLSISDQRRYAKEKIDIIVIRVVGVEKKYDTRRTSVYELAGEQIDQVFDGSHIRSLAEQRSYLESSAERKRQEAEDNAQPYTKPWKKIDDGRILIKTGQTGMLFTREDIVEMLSSFTRVLKK